VRVGCPLIVVLLVLGSSGCGGDDAPRPPQEDGAESPSLKPAASKRWPPFTVLGRRMDPGDLTWRVDDASCPVPGHEFRDAVIRAMARWEATGVARFVEHHGPGAPDLVFSWHGKDHPGCRFIEWDGGVAHAVGDGPTLAAIHFNTTVDWGRRSLHLTALHEVGHILGLGHSPDSSALMYGGYDDSHLALTDQDLAGLHSIYGGGEDRDTDLHVMHVDKRGALRPAAPALREVAPEPYAFAVLDVDGDEGDDVVLWRRDRTLGSMMIYRFMEGPRLSSSVGPLVGVTRHDRTTYVLTEQSAGPVLLDVLDDGRYLASGFNDRALPADSLGKEARVFSNGLADRDGDGVLEDRQPRPEVGDDGALIVGRTDVDGDGKPDHLSASGPDSTGVRRFRWRLSATGSPGPSFTAHDATVGDLDGDGRWEVVVRGLRR